jgi:hypothetical protein
MKWEQGAALLLVGLLVGAMPHVKTAGYYAAYEGIPTVPLETAAHWLTWAETDAAHAGQLEYFGVKTMDYTNPNRTVPGQVENSGDESTYAHDCSGNRISTTIGAKAQYLMDPHSPDLARRWRADVLAAARLGAHFDAVFSDDSNDIAYMPASPCNYNARDWLAATNRMQQLLGMPVIYNGLGNFSNFGVSESIGLNATAIGGVAENCYATSRGNHVTSGWQWRTMEETERLMARDGKLFFCYGNDTRPASGALQARLYVYASFLLTYDPDTSVLWEYYATPSNLRVMPEVQLVPTDPKNPQISSVDELRQSSDVYERVYRRCYLAGRFVGGCFVAVNPDPIPHPLDDARAYRETLALSGAGVADGGSAQIVGNPPPSELAPFSAVIAFR